MLDRSEQTARTKEAAIYNGTQFSHDEIKLAIDTLAMRLRVLLANMSTLTQNFDARKMVEIKLTAENIAIVAGDAKKTAAQIEALSANLASVFQTHINRKPRS